MGYLKKRKSSFMKNFFLFSFFSCVFFFIGFYFYFLNWFHTPIEFTSQEGEYYLSEGTSFSKVCYDLEKSYGLKKSKLFILYGKYFNYDSKIKPGSYSITNQDTPSTILQKFINGDSLKIKVTIPEGLNIYQISDKFSEIFPYTKKEKWLETICSQKIISILKLNQKIECAEGFLFPQTYFFDPREKPINVIASMLLMFQKNITTAIKNEAQLKNLDLYQLVTFASIIEKESGEKSEKPLIASVFWNRLKKNMKLQSDPTVIYGMWKNYDGNIHKKDLLTYSPYNTYTLNGLPKGPIANPSLGSILAIIHPAKTNYLFFVANGKGTHVFSNNYKDHSKAVKRLIEITRSRNQ